MKDEHDSNFRIFREERRILVGLKPEEHESAELWTCYKPDPERMDLV